MFVDVSATSAAEARYNPSPKDRADVLGNVRVRQSLRYGEQAYFWTESWQQAEKLAEFDRLADMDYKPTDIADLRRWLEEDDDD